MTLVVLSGFVVLLIGLLWIRRLQFEPDGVVESTAPVWDQPSPAAWVESPPKPTYIERAMGSSIGEIAAGVFLGIWMFVLSAAAVAVTVAVLFGSLSDRV